MTRPFLGSSALKYRKTFDRLLMPRRVASQPFCRPPSNLSERARSAQWTSAPSDRQRGQHARPISLASTSSVARRRWTSVLESEGAMLVFFRSADW